MRPTTTEPHVRDEMPSTPPWLNGLMRRVLRSPFSGLVDRGIVLLTVTGTVSCRRYTFPVQYVREDDTLWVMSGHASQKRWWRNLRSPAPVEVLLRRKARLGTAQAVHAGTDPELVAEGIRRYLARFPKMAARVGLPPDDPSAFARTAADTVIVRVALDG